MSIYEDPLGERTYNSSKPNNKRARLHRADPHCFWCGLETVITGYSHGEKVRDNTATIDHLYSNLHPNRTGNSHLKVLACYGCNQARSNCEVSGKQFVPLLPERLPIAVQATAPWSPQERKRAKAAKVQAPPPNPAGYRFRVPEATPFDDLQIPPPAKAKVRRLRKVKTVYQLPEDEPRYAPLTGLTNIVRDFRCWYCGTQIMQEVSVTTPRLYSCGGCYQVKGTFSIEEFRTFIQLLLGTDQPIVFFGEWNYFTRRRAPPANGLVIDGGLPPAVRREAM